jgi:phosphate transport system substrate-binding protein
MNQLSSQETLTGIEVRTIDAVCINCNKRFTSMRRVTMHLKMTAARHVVNFINYENYDKKTGLKGSFSLSTLLGLIAFAMLSTMIISVSASQKSFAQTQVTLNGAGATFPFPLIDTWRVAYQKVHPNVNINYQSIGSGGGVKQFTAKTVDFGASDAPLSAKERQAVPGAVQIPETIGSVVVGYKVPGIPTKTLKFTGPILADIFQGKITKWNDPQIKALNPGVNLPNANIVVVHRSDGSGTTYVWTSYLSKERPSWNQTIGASKSVPWPTGIGAPGNEGVANAIKGSPNTIGYVLQIIKGL